MKVKKHGLKGMKKKGDEDDGADLSLLKVSFKGGKASDHEPDVRNAEAQQLYFLNPFNKHIV